MEIKKIFFSIYKQLIFLLPPETAHAVTLSMAEKIYKSFLKNIIASKITTNEKKVMGITFPNILGLAAGFDKNGDYLNFINNIGLGFIEVGTVTPKPQYGNNKPRIFRVANEEAIINHLGFNNKGVSYLKEKLRYFNRNIPIGVNIGKNSNTSIDKAYEDYEYCMHEIFEFSDYLTLNISSPNTLKLRDLHSKDYLNNFLKRIKMTHEKLAKKYKKHVPLLLKISPDISQEDLSNICNSINHYDIDGVIATNTTVDKSILKNKKFLNYSGGISGKPLLEKSNKIIRVLKKFVGSDVAVIGCGGISSKETALNKIEAGSDLIQLYTGLVYSGASLIQEITSLKKNKFT